MSTALSAYAGLLINGDFEMGNLSGWTVFNQTGDGNFFAANNTNTPWSNVTTVGPSTGNWYALSDQNPPGDASVLIQAFTIPTNAFTVTLAYDVFVNDFSGSVTNAGGLDFGLPNNQHARVDLLVANALAFSTDAQDIVATFYVGADDFNAVPNPYSSQLFDISSLVTAGSTYQLRFAGVNNVSLLNIGIDNVDVVTTPQTAQVPEPSAFVSMLLMFSILIFPLKGLRQLPSIWECNSNRRRSPCT